MTVCIAGVCQNNRLPAIVLCADWQGTYNSGVKTDEAYKIRDIGRFCILFADDPTSADEMIALLTPVLRQYENGPKPEGDYDIRMSGLLRDIRACARKRQAEINEHHVGMKFGTSFAEFRAAGQQWLGPDSHREVWQEIRNLGLGCSLIIAYADDAEPMIITLGSDGDVSIHDCYCIIGSGTDVALAFLAQSRYDGNMTVFECAVHIHMAKSMAEKNVYVGESSMLHVLAQGTVAVVITDEGFDYIKSQTVENLLKERKIKFEEGFVGTSKSGKDA